MKLTLNKAAQACGRSKSTLLEAIKSGRLSAPKNELGHYTIDSSELHRVFPFQVNNNPEPVLNRPTEPLPTTPETPPEITALKRETDLLREMLEKAETNAEHWRLLAERQQALLEDKRPKGFLKRFWGR